MKQYVYPMEINESNALIHFDNRVSQRDVHKHRRARLDARNDLARRNTTLQKMEKLNKKVRKNLLKGAKKKHVKSQLLGLYDSPF